jgi:hypothetical protein
MAEIKLEIEGYPPAKGEALSMLGKGHSHASRVKRLLEAASDQANGMSFGFGPIGLEMTLRCARDRMRGDATNYLGGVGDVLENKKPRGALEDLGALALVHRYENDRQIEEIHYRWEETAEPSYEIRVRSLQP